MEVGYGRGLNGRHFKAYIADDTYSRVRSPRAGWSSLPTFRPSLTIFLPMVFSVLPIGKLYTQSQSVPRQSSEQVSRIHHKPDIVFLHYLLFDPPESVRLKLLLDPCRLY